MEFSEEEIAEQLRNPHGELAGNVGSEMYRKNKPMIEASIQALKIANRSRLLEIGFGNGGHINGLFSIQDTIQYSGIDISKPMVEEARRNCLQRVNEGKVQLSHTKGNTIPFGESTFDIAFSVNTIYFWDNPSGYLKDISRTLKPKGQLVLTFGSKKFMEDLSFTKHGFRLYNIHELEKMLVSSGFEMNNVQKMYDDVESATGHKIKREFYVVEAINLKA